MQTSQIADGNLSYYLRFRNLAKMYPSSSLAALAEHKASEGLRTDRAPDQF